jgi:hypothetical protein
MLIVYLGAIGGPILEIVPYKYEQTPFQSIQSAYAYGRAITIHKDHIWGDEGLRYTLDNIGTVFVRYSNTVKEL